MHEYSESPQSLLSSQTHKYRTLRVGLIKPAQYDDDGYVIRFWKGVLPSNTLSVLRGLTEDVDKRGVLGDITIQLDTCDEVAQKVPVERIIKWGRHSYSTMVVCLGAVKTTQKTQALDLRKQYLGDEIDVINERF